MRQIIVGVNDYHEPRVVSNILDVIHEIAKGGKAKDIVAAAYSIGSILGELLVEVSLIDNMLRKRAGEHEIGSAPHLALQALRRSVYEGAKDAITRLEEKFKEHSVEADAKQVLQELLDELNEE